MRALPIALAPLVLAAVARPARADVAHDVEAGYAASARAGAGRGEGGLVEASLGGDASDTIRIGAWQVAVRGGAAARRLEGAVRATGATTRARIAAGPVPLPPGNQDRYRTGWFPVSFELGHEGDLAALPRLSDRPDVRRAPYAWQKVSAATRLVRVEYAEDGIDQERDPEGLYPRDRETGAIDVLAVRADVEVTAQGDDRRVDATVSVPVASVLGRWPWEARADLLAYERRVARLREGRVATTDTLWFVRLEMPAPSGLTYSVAWGVMLDWTDHGARADVVDHREDRQLVAVGIGGGSDELGGGFQARRQPYVTLDGQAVFEDRFWLEAWFPARSIRWRGRAFLAKTRRIDASDEDGTWTGGVELGADRDVGPVAVGVQAETGRSFYAALDGGAPAAGFAARGALTVRRAASRRWFY